MDYPDTWRCGGPPLQNAKCQDNRAGLDGRVGLSAARAGKKPRFWGSFLAFYRSVKFLMVF